MTGLQRIGFVGAGPVGTAFGVSLSQQNYEVSAVHDLNRAAAERFARAVPGCEVCETSQELADKADLVFITTPDDVIPQVAAQVGWHTGQAVIHCSGACSTDILEPARQQGAMVGSIHPCQTFASIEQAVDNLPGSTFAVQGDEPLLGTLKELTAALHGSWVYLTADDKALYHAAAAIACNYVYTVVKLAVDLWQHFGKSTAEATEAYLPLLRGTVNNIGSVGFPGCLTGPIARGDLDTIRRHLEALATRAPSHLQLYKALGVATVPIALEKGTIDRSTADSLLELLAPD
jgi:predicted short-subunit dehydrogenase-like oxidoreductase (DUF2520 family)